MKQRNSPGRGNSRANEAFARASQLCKMGLHGSNLDVMMRSCCKRKGENKPGNATHASVKKEMAKPAWPGPQE
jgi:hypothetical protein